MNKNDIASQRNLLNIIVRRALLSKQIIAARHPDIGVIDDNLTSIYAAAQGLSVLLDTEEQAQTVKVRVIEPVGMEQQT